jgi:hypothetical protein
VWVAGVFQILDVTALQFHVLGVVALARCTAPSPPNAFGRRVAYTPIEWGPFDGRFNGWPEHERPATYAPLRCPREDPPCVSRTLAGEDRGAPTR